ncbi:MAG: HAMP domain-containing histidine kinase [Candidatus Rokubacteria bacterium]|nr:HAMP domain-containing histidine kinase [Candidatus Rokubacteria bacterium]
MALTIARKIFLAFCAVLLVVLGLGLWSLHATRRLHDLNRSLLTQAIPALQEQIALTEQIATLVRHATRAIVWGESDYLVLHHHDVAEFRARLDELSRLLDGREAREAWGAVRTGFGEYVDLFDREWEARHQGRRVDPQRVSAAAEALRTALAALLTQSRVDQAKAAGGLERSARTAAVLSLGLSLAVGVAVAGMVNMRIARPIRALARSTALVAQGQYDLPIVVKSQDEVGHLARAFGEMARKLGEMEALKEEFFATISHDLRNPLTSIQAAMWLLLRNGGGDPVSPKQRHLLGIVRTDAEKLLRLINQILDLSKIRSGMVELDLRLTDLGSVVESAVQELRPLAEEKGVTLRVALPDPSLKLRCDEERVQLVLVNLLSNAVKFTPPGGEVRLGIREAGETLVLCVEDTGVGIPADRLPHIFDRYYQAHRGRGGTGLGLATVKGFVEAHGGRVWAESEEGKGSRFSVALPQNGTSE